MLVTIEAILTALNAASVRYLVVGGVAVVLHGELRITADLDLVVQLDPDNAGRAMTTLDRLGFRPRAPLAAASFADASVRKVWIEQEGLTVFSLWSPAHPGFELDLFVAEPFDFDAVYGRAVRVPIRGTYAVVVSIDDLIAMKPSVGSGRDLDDAAALEALRAQRPPTKRPGWTAPMSRSQDGFDHGWEGHARRQACLGLELSPAERLQWLERTLEEMREILGRARPCPRGRP